MVTWLLILIIGRGVAVAITALPWPYETKAACIMAGHAFVSGEAARTFACIPAPEGQ